MGICLPHCSRPRGNCVTSCSLHELREGQRAAEGLPSSGFLLDSRVFPRLLGFNSLFFFKKVLEVYYIHTNMHKSKVNRSLNFHKHTHVTSTQTKNKKEETEHRRASLQGIPHSKEKERITWTNLKNIMLSQRSLTQRGTNCMTPFTDI